MKPNIKSYIQSEKFNLYTKPNDNELTGMYLVQTIWPKF